MLDQEDLKWIASSTTDLNSVLQQIARYSDLARRHKGQYNYIDLLGERVELASKKAQAIFDRVTSRILEKTAEPQLPSSPSLRVLPPPLQPGTAPAPAVPSAGSGKFNEAFARVSAAVGSLAAAKKEPSSQASPGIPTDIIVRNPKGNRELILLIEDEAEVADLAGEMLAMQGYRVIVVNDGVAALKIYERIGPQIALVILDFFLPILDGDAVFDELKALNPEINVVLSSGFAEQGKISSMLAQGLRGFIPKPYTSERLLMQVRSILDASRQTVA